VFHIDEVQALSQMPAARPRSLRDRPGSISAACRRNQTGTSSGFRRASLNDPL